MALSTCSRSNDTDVLLQCTHCKSAATVSTLQERSRNARHCESVATSTIIIGEDSHHSDSHYKYSQPQ